MPSKGRQGHDIAGGYPRANKMRREANRALDMESLVPSGAAAGCQTGNVWSSWDPCHVPNSCEGKHCVLEAAGGVRREPLEFIKLPGSLGVECRGRTTSFTPQFAIFANWANCRQIVVCEPVGAK